MATASEKIYSCPTPLGACESTIGELLFNREVKFSTRPLLLERKSRAAEFQSYTWKEIYAQIRQVGNALLDQGVKPGDRVGLLSENRQEMFVATMAIYSIGAINVPIFFGYFPEQVHYILEHSGARFLIVADAAQLAKVGSREQLPGLEKIFVMDESKVATGDPRLHSYASLLEAKVADVFDAHVERTQPDDTCVVMYTSGTTGRPKGVELTHRNIISQQRAISLVWEVSPKDRFLSYLPWHHCFGGLFETFMAVYNGVPMALDASRGKDLDLLMENWKIIRPTIYFSVPMIYQMLVTEMRQDPALLKILFHPDLRFVFTAAAPLPPDLYGIFLDQGVQVHEGWGLTESSPDITLTRPGKKTPSGVVGDVLPGVTIRIAEDGEIFCQGPNVMKGYYRDPESTRAVLDKGWLRTGDLGEMTADGLRIVGRADGVFKLVNGEKVPSAQIEGTLVSVSKYIERAVAVGRGHDYVVALLVPQEKELRAWAQAKGLSCENWESFLASDPVRALFQEDVRHANQRLDTKYYRVRKFHLVPRPLTLEKGELTPTSKVCRQRVMENFAAIIEAMYRGVPESLARLCANA